MNLNRMDDRYGMTVAKRQEIAARRLGDCRISAGSVPLPEGTDCRGSYGGLHPVRFREGRHE